MNFFILLLCVNIKLVSNQMQPYIVGGENAKIEEYPHAVFLSVNCVYVFICGGSILTNRIILTAAHCLDECLNVKKPIILVKYGHEYPGYMLSARVAKFIIHNNYNSLSLANDIAMIYTTDPIQFGKFVKRVAILRRFPRRVVFAYVSGWGVVNSAMEMATSLKHVYQRFPSYSTCKLLGLTPGTFCSGSVDATEYPEQGDSGGALMVFGYVQIGIVSFKHPDVGLIGYTNTTYFYNWIYENTIRLTCT